MHGTMGQQKMQERSAEMLVFQARSVRHHKKWVGASLLDISWIILSSDSYMNMREIIILAVKEVRLYDIRIYI